MSDLPTLTVDGSSSDWLAVCDVLTFEGPEVHDHPDVFPCPKCGKTGTIPLRHTVRIDGPLPTVCEVLDQGRNWMETDLRPLRVGDRVHLVVRELIFPTDHQHRLRIFATATVAKIDTVREHLGRDGDIFVTVTDVEAL